MSSTRENAEKREYALEPHLGACPLDMWAIGSDSDSSDSPGIQAAYISAGAGAHAFHLPTQAAEWALFCLFMACTFVPSLQG